MILPVSYENQMMEILGEEYGSFMASYEEPHFSALRRNTRKITESSLRGVLGVSEDETEGARVAWENAGFYYSTMDECKGDGCVGVPGDDVRRDGLLRLEHPGKSVYHDAGLYYIQEPSAMLPVNMLDVDDSGMRVLDLCASPGGKTTQIADRMKGRGILFANEIMPQRARILSENIERMGVSNAVVISADPKDICDRFEGYFDRILVDAPCSGEGMIRKHPETIEEWSPENVVMCAQRQAWILDCAAMMLRPGGKLVYSTCTFNRLEDEGSVNDFLQRNADFVQTGDCHRLFPHRDRGEGHFAAAFEKSIPSGNDELTEAYSRRRKTLTEKPARKDMYKPFEEFAQQSLTKKGRDKLSDIEGMYIMFGEQLYLAPAEIPALKGLKVLRPGLHLGSIAKGRFEPSHALALFLEAEDVLNVYNIENEGTASLKYLKGETLPDAAGKGWTLVAVSGYSVGWGKVSNNILKNHYPKGLRWN